MDPGNLLRGPVARVQSTAPATMNEMYEQCFLCSAETTKKNLSSKPLPPMRKGPCTALWHTNNISCPKLYNKYIANMPQKNPDQKPGFMHTVVKNPLPITRRSNGDC